MEPHGGGGSGKRRRSGDQGRRNRHQNSARGVWWPVSGQGEVLVEGIDFVPDSEVGGGDEFVFIPDSDSDHDGTEDELIDEFVPDTEVQPDAGGAVLCCAALGEVIGVKEEQVSVKPEKGGVKAERGGVKPEKGGVKAEQGGVKAEQRGGVEDAVAVAELCGVEDIGGHSQADEFEDCIDLGGMYDIAGHSQADEDILELGGVENIAGYNRSGRDEDILELIAPMLDILFNGCGVF